MNLEDKEEGWDEAYSKIFIAESNLNNLRWSNFDLNDVLLQVKDKLESIVLIKDKKINRRKSTDSSL